MLLMAVAYPPISDKGTKAKTTRAFPLISVDWISALLEERSAIISPKNSSGVVTSTFIIGSSKTICALAAASDNPNEPAILKDISEESTSLKDPSYTATLISVTGYP